jgi:hypothetical protein
MEGLLVLPASVALAEVLLAVALRAAVLVASGARLEWVGQKGEMQDSRSEVK